MTLRIRKSNSKLTFLLLVAPALVLYLGMIVWPFLNMLILSTFRWRGIVRPKEFVGLVNYIRLFKDPGFRQALGNTGIHYLIGLPLGILPGFFFGYFLHFRKPGHNLFRIMFFLPVMLSAAGVSMLFKGIFLPNGILNTLLQLVGSEGRHWLADPSTALLSIIAADTWGSIGFQSMFFYAIIGSVPRELYEAARLEGCGHGALQWKIVFPLIIDSFGVLLMMRTKHILIGSAQVVMLLTGGAPKGKTVTIGFYLYDQAFVAQRLGYSQAVGVFSLIVGLTIIFVIRLYTRRNDLA